MYIGIKERYDYKRDKEASARISAKFNNNHLVIYAKTKFKVGDLVLVSGRTEGRISKVHPKGYITVPGSYACYSMRWLEPVTCDVDIYQYEIKDKSGRYYWGGQTTEENIKLLEGVTNETV